MPARITAAATISQQCRRAAEWRGRLLAVAIESALGMGNIGVVITLSAANASSGNTSMVNTGMAAIGATTGTGIIIMTTMMSSSSAASVFRSGVGGVIRTTMTITRTAIIPTVIRTDTATVTTGVIITTTEMGTVTTTGPTTG